AAINAALEGMTYTPTPGSSGSDTLTITTDDEGNTGVGGPLSDTDAVEVTVQSVNQAPFFIKGPDQTVNDDAGPQVVPNCATGISAGPPSESAQELTFIVNNINPALFATPPSISSVGPLTYTPAPNANGAATITIVLKDTGGTANGGVDTSPPQTFIITVNPI